MSLHTRRIGALIATALATTLAPALVAADADASAAACTVPAVHTFVPATGTDNPFGISPGPDRTTWYAHGASINKIANGRTTVYPVADPRSADLGWVAYRGGPVVWFADRGTGRIGVVSATGRMHEYEIPNGTNGMAVPQSFVFGPGRLVWFTDQINDRLGRFDPTSRTFTFYTVPSAGSTPLGMVRGADGDLYLTERTADKVARFEPATGLFTEWTLGTDSFPNRLAVDPSGKVWFTELHSEQIGYIGTDGHLHERALTGGAVGLIYHHGYLYAALNEAGELARISLTGRVVHTWPLPHAGGVLQLTYSNGFVWVADTFGNHVYRVSTQCS